MASEYIQRGAGNDVITTGSGNDTIYAGDGNNRVKAGGGSNQIYTGSGNDTISAGGTARDFNYIDAGAGNDCIDLGAACDTVLIGSGNNTLYAGAGNDKGVVKFSEAVAAKNFMCGGAGCDTLVLQFTQAELARADVQADLARYQAALASGKGCNSFQFTSMALKVINWEKLEIQIINKDPVLPAVPPAFEGKEDHVLNLNLLATATDPDGDVLTLTSVEGAENGTMTINADGTVTYTPEPNWSGTETVTYTVDDGKGGTAPGTATFTIAPVADEPTLSLSFPTLDTLFLEAALTDTDGSETLSVSIQLPDGVSLAAADGSYDAEADLWTFSQAALDRGQVTFVTDGIAAVPPELDLVATVHDGGDVLTKSFKVHVINRNPDLPELQQFIGTEDEVLSLNLLTAASDPDGDTLRLTSVSSVDGNPLHGTLEVNPDGSVTFTPTPNWAGTETVTYVVEDGKGGRTEGTASFTIAGVADAPEINLRRPPEPKISLDVALTDTDGSESLSVTIKLPSDMSLVPADGTYDAATGLWTFSEAALAKGEASFMPKDDGARMPVEVELQATVTESDGDVLTTTYRLASSDDDTVTVTALPKANEIVDGNEGIDTLVFRGITDLDLTALATNSLRNFEQIDMKDASRTNLTLSANLVSSMSSEKTLHVVGDAGDTVTLADKANWTEVGTMDGFDVYRSNLLTDVTLHLQSGLAVI